MTALVRIVSLHKPMKIIHHAGGSEHEKFILAAMAEAVLAIVLAGENLVNV